MLSSMTGFGRSNISTSFGQLVIEIQSLNRKFFEAAILMPKEYMRYENEVRKWISEKIFRGQITVRMQLITDPFSKDFSDIEVMKKLKIKWRAAAKELGFDPKSIDFGFLLKQYEQLPAAPVAQDEKAFTKVLKEGVFMALKHLLSMKKLEGGVLLKELLKRLDIIKKKLILIEKKAPSAAVKYHDRLKKKLKEFCDQEDERLLKEVAIYADKIDVTEEVTRFHSHLEQFCEHLKVAEKTKGRKLEFLLQEMFREMNTLGAKASEVEMSKKALEIKTELEKIREQIQNVE